MGGLGDTLRGEWPKGEERSRVEFTGLNCDLRRLPYWLCSDLANIADMAGGAVVEVGVGGGEFGESFREESSDPR